MEIPEVINTQFIFPGLVVGLVLVCAVLVFVFGFKSVEDFPFDKLATVADDRKPAGKKRKVKDKKSQTNGQATVVSETKQKSSESTTSKVAAAKVKQVEKSPAKDVPKASSKQEKKQGNKTEASPVKAALKETKNIKETNKITEDGQKQGKTKEVATKQPKDQQSNKSLKSKGKENVEVLNRKNVEKSKIKTEEKPKDYDDGEWETFSRKDKKSRKPVTADGENMAEKLVKTEVASPGKKKKAAKVAADPEPTPPPPATPTPAPTTVADKDLEPVKEKPAKKEKEPKKEKPKQSEEAPVVESAAVNTESEGEGKTKKKKKKPAAKENSEVVTPVVEVKTVAEEEIVPSKPKTVELKQTEEAENTPVFDEIGDVWKEAKPQKKASKKKVRKAE